MKIIFAGDSMKFFEVIEVTLDDQGEAWDTKNKPNIKLMKLKVWLITKAQKFKYF